MSTATIVSGLTQLDPPLDEILLPAAAVANSTHPEHVESVVKSRGKPSVTPMQRTRHLEATAHPATTPSPRSDLPRVPQSPPPSYLPFYLVLAVSVLVALTLLAHVTYLHVLSKQKGESLLVPRHLSDIPLAMRDRGPPMARIRPRVRF